MLSAHNAAKYEGERDTINTNICSKAALRGEIEQLQADLSSGAHLNIYSFAMLLYIGRGTSVEGQLVTTIRGMTLALSKWSIKILGTREHDGDVVSNSPGTTINEMRFFFRIVNLFPFPQIFLLLLSMVRSTPRPLCPRPRVHYETISISESRRKDESIRSLDSG